MYHFLLVSALLPDGSKTKVNSLATNSQNSNQTVTYLIISVAGGVVMLIFMVICAVGWRTLQRGKRRESDCIDESTTDSNLNKKNSIKFEKCNGNSIVSLDTTTTMTTTTTPLIHKSNLNGSDSLWSRSFQQRLQHPSSPLSASGNRFTCSAFKSRFLFSYS